jgi:hypothetical protein
MSQGLRDILTNRRFAIPLIILLAFCFIGILLIGIVLIWRPGLPAGQQPEARVELTATQAATSAVAPTKAAPPTQAPTAKPTPTLVPVGTAVSSGGDSTTELGSPAAAPTSGQSEASAGGSATVQPTPTTGGSIQGAGTSQQQDPGSPAGDSELAETGVGWGLVLASSMGLAVLAFVAHRLRLAN